MQARIVAVLTAELRLVVRWARVQPGCRCIIENGGQVGHASSCQVTFTHHQMDMDGMNPAAASLQAPQLDGVLAHVLPGRGAPRQGPDLVMGQHAGMQVAGRCVAHKLQRSLRQVARSPLHTQVRPRGLSTAGSPRIRCEACQGTWGPCSPSLCKPSQLVRIRMTARSHRHTADCRYACMCRVLRLQ